MNKLFDFKSDGAERRMADLIKGNLAANCGLKREQGVDTFQDSQVLTAGQVDWYAQKARRNPGGSFDIKLTGPATIMEVAEAYITSMRAKDAEMRACQPPPVRHVRIEDEGGIFEEWNCF